MRRSFYFALSFFSVGMFMGAKVFSRNLVFVLILILLASLIYTIKKSDKYSFSVGILFLIIGFISYNGIYNYKILSVKDYVDTKSTVTLKITDNGTKNTSYVKYTAKIKDINTKKENIKVLVTFPKKFNFNYGDVLTLKDVTLKIPHEAHTAFDFDYRMYLKAKGIFITVYADSINIENKTEGKGIIRSLYTFRGKISEKIEEHLKDDRAAVANAIITGDKSDISRKIKNDFKRSGISHLLAVSGLHLTLLVMYLGCFFRKENYVTNRFIKPIFSICVTLCAMIVTGFGFSVIRAGLMLIICNISKLLGREKSNLNSLMIAAGIIVISNPYSVFDIGFELSFFATLGILLFGDSLQRFLVSKLKFKYISSLLTTTLCAQVFTVPITILYYNTFSLYSVLANLLAVPLFTLLLISVIFFVFASFLCPFAVVIKIFTGNIYIFTKLVLYVASFISGLPYAVIGITKIEFFLTLAFILALYLAYKAIKLADRKTYKVTAYVLIPICVFGVLFVNYDQKNLEVTYLDVGQGSCCHISMPNGENVLIDCGVSKYYTKEDVGYKVENYLTKSVVDSIDYAILTHYHDDHYSGFITLMDRGVIKTMVLPKVRNEEDIQSYLEIVNCAAKNGVDVMYFKRGARLNFDDAKIYAISPLGGKELSSNDESLVMKLVYNNTGFLFTGDIENEGMKNLKENELSANVIVSPHHGSKTSVYDEFYASTGADYSVISAGYDNSYGHPHKEHLEVLGKNNISFFRTDINKNIYFKVDKKGNIKYRFEEGGINEGA